MGTPIANSNDQYALGTGGPNPLRKAGNRLWVPVHHGSHGDGPGIFAWRSEDGAASTKGPQFSSVTQGRAFAPTAYRDAALGWHLAVAIGANNTPSSVPLTLSQIHAGVDSGAPGAPTAGVTLDAGGTSGAVSLGVTNPFLLATATPTRPRLWCLGKKNLSDAGAQKFESRLWVAGITDGTTPDTAANWDRIDGLTAPNTSLQHDGVMTYMTVSGQPRVLIVCQDAAPNPDALLWYLFDPTAATVDVGPPHTGLGTLPSGGWPSSNTRGVHMALVGLDDFAVLSYWDGTNPSTLQVLTFDGTDWETLSSHAGARPRLISDGVDVHYLYVDSIDLTSTATADDAKTVRYRKITNGGTTFGSAEDLGEVSGFMGAAILGDDLVYAGRDGTATPYGVFFDSKADVVTAAAVAPPVTNFQAITGRDGQVPITLQMPNAANLRYTVRRAAGDTPPASAAAGDQVRGWTTAAALESVSFTDTDVDNGEDYSYAAFADFNGVGGSTSTAVTATALPQKTPTIDTPAFDGAQVPAQPTMGWTAEPEIGRIGDPQRYRASAAAPGDVGFTNPLQVLRSANGDGPFEYEHAAGDWRQVPLSGLPEPHYDKPVRVRFSILTDPGPVRLGLEVEVD